MKSFRFLLSLLLISAFTITAQSQVLITLLFGDKLNTETNEFGLIGGASFSTLDGIDQADYSTNFSLGFYFNKQLNDKLYFHTGATPKSTFGAKGLKTFPTGNADLDSLLTDGELEVRFGQISVPLLISYRPSPQVGVEVGPQVSIRTKVKNIYTSSVDPDNELSNEVTISDEFNSLNFELVGGLYYRLKSDLGMSIALRYYYGMNDLVKDNEGDAIKHQAFSLTASIPVGREKSSSPTSD